MSDVEALEYRIKENKRLMFLLGAIILFTQAGVFLTLGVISLGIAGALFTGLALVPLAGGYLLIAGNVAIQREGMSRRLLSRLFGESDDPPLNTWKESLEERNAFPVDGDSE